MSYIRYVKSIKGLDIIWKNNNIFPFYKNISGSTVSNKRLKHAKNIVLLILKEERNKIENAFKTLAKKKFNNKPIFMKFDFKSSINRVINTVLSNESDDLYGESDGVKIWICKNKLSDQDLVGTILHESLHYICTFNNKDICEKDEHYVMKLLGEEHEC